MTTDNEFEKRVQDALNMSREARHDDQKQMEEFLERVKELEKTLTQHYSAGKPVVADDVYDKLVEELVKFNGEKSRPFTRNKQSAAVNDVVGTLPKVYGVKEPMRPGQKTYMEWTDNVIVGGGIDNNMTVCVQPKYDGCSVALDCETGRYFTRGDYDNGESMDVTALFSNSKAIHIAVSSSAYVKLKAIKFEAIMSEEAFHSSGLSDKYVNARAATSAIIMSRDLKLVDYIDLMPLRLYFENGEMAIDPNLSEHSVYVSIDAFDSIQEFIDEQLENGAIVANDLYTDSDAPRHYAIDGVVVSIMRDATDTVILNGVNTEIAIKILNNVKETTIKNIEWQMGKTGKITPVGILEPVTFDNGVTVDHVGLSTFERVFNLQLHFGDTVRVMHNIVPYLLDSKHDGGMMIPMPVNCPICGYPLDLSKLRTVRCINPDCQNKKLGDIIRYCETMKIIGLSKGILTKLYEMGYVKSIPDLYRIDTTSLALEKGFAETSVKLITSAINDASHRVPPERWFGAWPCMNVSQKTWKQIFDYNLKRDDAFVNVLVNELDHGTCEGFLQILVQPTPNVGETTWKAIITGIRNSWDDMVITLRNITFLVDMTASNLALGNICLSGTRDKMMIQALKDAGYGVTDSWSNDVRALIIPDTEFMSSKVHKANKRNIPVLTYNDVMTILATQDNLEKYL